MQPQKSRTCFIASVAALAIAVTIVSWAIPKLVSKQVQQNVQIDNSSKMFDKWVKLPIPLAFKVYVFNVTNAEQVNGGAKPVLKEIGPYVYKEYREKTILGYGENDTIQYTLKKSFVFDEEESRGLSEDDDITVINLSYLGAILAVQDLAPSILGLVNTALEHFFPDLQDAFLRVKVKDLFFDGIFLNCTSDQPDNALGLICGKIKLDKPPTMRPAEDGTGYYFSMFSHMNLSESKPFEVVRGTEDVYRLGDVVSYNSKREMKVWKDPYCMQINGSDGMVFPPIDHSNVPQKLYTFEPDICRSLYASLVGKKSLFNMDTYYYEVSEEALASKSANPNNKCFCKRNWSAVHDGCLLMGVLNLQPCQGAPVIASFPHFYLASEELLEYIPRGLSPNKDKHNTYLHLDPITGVVLKGVRRLQFNIELRNIPTVPQLANVKTGLFPLLWIEEGAELPEDLQEELQASHRLLGYVDIGRWALLAAAVAGVLLAAYCVLRSSSLNVWRNSNSVSFVPNVNDLYGNKR